MSFSIENDMPRLSVVIPVVERHDDLGDLIADYDSALSKAVAHVDYTVIIDGQIAEAHRQLESLAGSGMDLRIIRLSRSFGEANALAIGFDKTDADFVLTLPAYRQVEASKLSEILAAIKDCDMVAARRWPRHDSTINQWTTRLFHTIIRWITRYDFRDLGCGVRLMRRHVIDEISLYGDQHRFLPMLVAHRGFNVKEKSINQSSLESRVRFYAPRVYFQRLLDVITVFFLTRFTKKPLRFFGIVGGSLFLIGLAILAVVVVQRLFFGVSLGDRPALVITTLMMVLGAQLIGLGLIGELVIFANARTDTEYTVAETVNLLQDEESAKA